MGIRNPLKKKRPPARGQAGRFIFGTFRSCSRSKDEPEPRAAHPSSLRNALIPSSSRRRSRWRSRPICTRRSTSFGSGRPVRPQRRGYIEMLVKPGRVLMWRFYGYNVRRTSRAT
jgi:hypothetical protein